MLFAASLGVVSAQQSGINVTTEFDSTKDTTKVTWESGDAAYISISLSGTIGYDESGNDGPVRIESKGASVTFGTGYGGDGATASDGSEISHVEDGEVQSGLEANMLSGPISDSDDVKITATAVNEDGSEEVVLYETNSGTPPIGGEGVPEVTAEFSNEGNNLNISWNSMSAEYLSVSLSGPVGYDESGDDGPIRIESVGTSVILGKGNGGDGATTSDGGEVSHVEDGEVQSGLEANMLSDSISGPSDIQATITAVKSDGTEVVVLDQSTSNLGTEVSVPSISDGDTVDIRYKNGSEDVVRMLGVDTPETEIGRSTPNEFEGVPDTKSGKECLVNWGKKASSYTETNLLGSTVGLSFDETTGRRGYYGRLLGYLSNAGEEFNKKLIRNGYARVYLDSEFNKKEEYLKLEQSAQSENAGLWACTNPSNQNDGVIAKFDTTDNTVNVTWDGATAEYLNISVSGDIGYDESGDDGPVRVESTGTSVTFGTGYGKDGATAGDENEVGHYESGEIQEGLEANMLSDGLSDGDKVRITVTAVKTDGEETVVLDKERGL
jgi:micrococcal nuclease